MTFIGVSERWSSPADNKTAVIPRELRAVKRLEHLNLLLNAVQLISGVLQLDNLHSPQPQKKNQKRRELLTQSVPSLAQVAQ